MIRCANCDAEIPEGGQFCVECGAPVPQASAAPARAALGPTERLARAAGPACPSCGTPNPPGAVFCVACGRAIEDRPAAAAAPIAPALSTPPPAPVVAAPPPRRAGRRGDQAMWSGVGGGLFLIGLAVLFFTGWWWPGILVLVGLSAILGSIARPKFG